MHLVVLKFILYFWKYFVGKREQHWSQTSTQQILKVTQNGAGTPQCRQHPSEGPISWRRCSISHQTSHRASKPCRTRKKTLTDNPQAFWNIWGQASSEGTEDRSYYQLVQQTSIGTKVTEKVQVNINQLMSNFRHVSILLR